MLILDYDAHHGNGTQAAFYDDPRVLFVSLHQWPLYPGTGRLDRDRRRRRASGTTMNVPLPAGATGDVYLRAFDEVVAPVVERFAPTWLLISAGFDAHRDDPITELGLTAGDYPLLTRAGAAARRRRADAWRCSRAATTSTRCRRARRRCSATLAGVGRRIAEAPSSGGPGRRPSTTCARLWTAG